MRLHKASLLMALLILTFMAIFPERAIANGGPPQMTGDKAGALLPGKSSTVHVLSESLRIELTDDLEQAQVTVRYRLENRGEAVTLPVLFVIQDLALAWQRGSEPSISWNGQPRNPTRRWVDALPDEERRRLREAWGAESQVIDPLTGERYTLLDYRGRPRTDELTYYQFDLVLPAGATGDLQVTYAQQAGYHRGRYVHPVYHYHYLLLPAKGWASFGPLEVAIEAPPASRAFFQSSLPLTWSDGAYRSSLPGLPDQNLTFSFMSRKGIIGSMVQARPYYWLTAILLLGAALLMGKGLGRMAAAVPSRTEARLVAFSAALIVGAPALFAVMLGLFNLFPWLIIYGYASTPFIGMVQLFLSVLLALLTAQIFLGRYHPRSKPPHAAAD